MIECKCRLDCELCGSSYYKVFGSSKVYLEEIAKSLNNKLQDKERKVKCRACSWHDFSLYQTAVILWVTDREAEKHFVLNKAADLLSIFKWLQQILVLMNAKSLPANKIWGP